MHLNVRNWPYNTGSKRFKEHLQKSRHSIATKLLNSCHWRFASNTGLYVANPTLWNIVFSTWLYNWNHFFRLIFVDICRKIQGFCLIWELVAGKSFFVQKYTSLLLHSLYLVDTIPPDFQFCKATLAFCTESWRNEKWIPKCRCGQWNFQLLNYE